MFAHLHATVRFPPHDALCLYEFVETHDFYSPILADAKSPTCAIASKFSLRKPFVSGLAPFADCLPDWPRRLWRSSLAPHVATELLKRAASLVVYHAHSHSTFRWASRPCCSRLCANYNSDSKLDGCAVSTLSRSDKCAIGRTYHSVLFNDAMVWRNARHAFAVSRTNRLLRARRFVWAYWTYTLACAPISRHNLLSALTSIYKSIPHADVYAPLAALPHSHPQTTAQLALPTFSTVENRSVYARISRTRRRSSLSLSYPGDSPRRWRVSAKPADPTVKFAVRTVRAFAHGLNAINCTRVCCTLADGANLVARARCGSACNALAGRVRSPRRSISNAIRFVR